MRPSQIKVKVVITFVLTICLLMSSCKLRVNAQTDLSGWKEQYEQSDTKYREYALKKEQEMNLPKGIVEGVIWHESSIVFNYTIHGKE